MYRYPLLKFYGFIKKGDFGDVTGDGLLYNDSAIERAVWGPTPLFFPY
jgi:hypothetical protein